MAETRTPLLDGNPFADGAEDAGGYVSPERGRNSLSASVSGHGNAAAPAAGSRFSGPLFYACPFILANEFCERLAYYGLATNLVTYLGTDAKMGVMQLDKSTASAMQQAWSGTCYLTAIIGAVVADALLGRFRTIVIFCLIYALGMSLLTCSAGLISSWHPVNGEMPTGSQSASLYMALYVIALGTGGIKPNVSSFGADQFDPDDPVAMKQKQSFFNYFYMVINVGSLIASTAIVQVQATNWTLGFAIPTIAMFVSVVCFVAGSGRYRHSPRPVGGSPITRAVRVMWQSYRESRRARSRSYIPRPATVPEESRLLSGEGDVKATSIEIPLWLQYGMHERGGAFTRAQVEEVALITRLVPVMLTGVVFWAVYSQMSSTFVLQGAQMDCRLGAITIQQASLSSFDTIIIIILIPLFDKVLYPLLRRSGFRVSNLQRTGCGYLFAVFAMLAAAAVESGRLKLFKKGDVFPSPPALPPPFPAPPQPAGRHLLAAAPGEMAVVQLSVFAQIPQYMLVGTAEVLAAVAQLDWFYSEAPASMRSCAMALQLLSVAMGGYFATAMTLIIQAATSGGGSEGWFPDDLNHGRLDLFFLLVAALMLLDFFAFWYCAQRFVSVAPKEEGAIVVGVASLSGVGSESPNEGSSFASPGMSRGEAISATAFLTPADGVSAFATPTSKFA